MQALESKLQALYSEHSAKLQAKDEEYASRLRDLTSALQASEAKLTAAANAAQQTQLSHSAALASVREWARKQCEEAEVALRVRFQGQFEELKVKLEADLQARSGALQTEYESKLQAQLARQRSEAEQQAGILEAECEQRVGKLEEECGQRMGQLEEEMQRLTGELERRDAECNALKAEVQGRSSNPSSATSGLSTEVIELQKTVQELERQLAKHKRKLQEAQCTGNLQTAQIKQAIKDMQSLRAVKTRLVKDNKALREREASQAKNLQGVGRINEQLFQENDELRARLSQLNPQGPQPAPFPRPPAPQVPVASFQENDELRARLSQLNPQGPQPAPFPLPPAPQVPVASGPSSYAAVVAAGSQRSADTKERNFVFLFKGLGIDFSVFEGDWRFKKVETGDLDAATKYCVISLHRKAGRRPANLVNVVHEYNGRAREAFRVELQMDKVGGARQPLVPALYLMKSGYAGNPATLKLMSDQCLQPSTYQSWTNPRRPGRAVTASGGSRTVAQPSSEWSQEEEEGRSGAGGAAAAGVSPRVAGGGVETEDEDEDEESDV